MEEKHQIQLVQMSFMYQKQKGLFKVAMAGEKWNTQSSHETCIGTCHFHCRFWQKIEIVSKMHLQKNRKMRKNLP